MRGRVSYSLYYSVGAVCGVHDLSLLHTLWVSHFVHATKGHVLHKQLLHYSIGSRILSLSYYILLTVSREETECAICTELY